MEAITLRKQSALRRAITRKYKEAKPSAITFQRKTIKPYVKGQSIKS